MTKHRPDEIVRFRTTLINAIAALEALMRGNCLSIYLDDLESVSSSLNTVAVLPMLFPKGNIVPLDGTKIIDDQSVHLFILDVFNRRGPECHLSGTPSRQRDLHIMSWHQSLLKALCGTQPLHDADRRHLQEVMAALHILSLECVFPDDPKWIVARLSKTYATAVV